MANNYFSFKEFTVQQSDCNMKVCTDSCLFGAWSAKDISKNTSFKVALDIGAGTGLLSLMIAQQNKNIKVDAVEIDSPAAIQANENFANSLWKNNFEIINKGILDFIPSHDYDVIITNPPFFAGSLKSPNNAKNIPKHEDLLPLTSIITYIKKYLKYDGIGYLLLPFYRAEEADKVIKSAGLYISEKINVRQKETGDFFRIIIKVIKTECSETLVEEINILNRENKYSEEFVELLRPYYLNL